MYTCRLALMHGHMCVYMYVCMHICMCVCINDISMYTFRYVKRQTYKSVYRKTCIYVHTHKYHIHVCINICVYVVHKYTVETYICIYIKPCMYGYIYAQMYALIHICL